MPKVNVAEAKARFAGLVDDASRGKFVTITRHRKPAAVPVSIEAAEAARLFLSVMTVEEIEKGMRNLPRKGCVERASVRNVWLTMLTDQFAA